MSTKRQGGKAKPVRGGGGKKQSSSVDKTFGMKNKKGKAAQKVVQTYNTAGKSKEDKKKEMEREQKKKAREEKEKLEAERAMLFKKVEVKHKQKPQTAPPGVDPKSIVCINFKAGFCSLGDTCPFSHDLTVERKSEKRDLFVDQREIDLKNDTMDTWDEKKLAEVVAKKTAGKPGNPTAGICNHFLRAIDEQKFGWFWECPSGEKCQYRHALPPGYVIKKPKKEEKIIERPLEDILEEKRLALPNSGLTRVTSETFQKWKEKLLKQKEVEEKKNKKARDQAIQSGRLKKTGREILQEGINSFKEELEEQDLDINSFLKQKKEEEEALDRANAEFVKIISDEVFQSEREFDKQVAELESQGLSVTEAIAKLKKTSPEIDNHDRDVDPDSDDDRDVDPDKEKDSVALSPTDDASEDDNNGEEETTENNDEGETSPLRENNSEEENSPRVNNSALIGVDEGLFAHEAEEDLPDISDDD